MYAHVVMEFQKYEEKQQSSIKKIDNLTIIDEDFNIPLSINYRRTKLVKI